MSNTTMATATSTGKYWIMTLVSFVVTVGFLIIAPEWFWVPLPFLLTGFVKAMNWVDPS